MTGTIPSVMGLLVLSMIRAGVKGQHLIFAEKGFDIAFPCEEDLVCFHIWHFRVRRRRDYIAIVSNGEIQTGQLQTSKCSLEIRDLTDEDVGHYRCPNNPDFSSENTIPQLNLFPGKTMSLQCVLLSYIEQGRCNIRLQQLSLMWLNEAGAVIEEDSEHQIKQESPCDVTLTVTFQNPTNKKFRCQATVGGRVQTSMELRVRVPDFKGRGRGLIIEGEAEDQEDHVSGGKQGVVGTAVAVAGCVVLTAIVAVFVAKRRTRNQLLSDSCNTTTTNNVVTADDVIYADVILPVSSGHAWFHEYEPTEYACVRNT